MGGCAGGAQGRGVYCSGARGDDLCSYFETKAVTAMARRARPRSGWGGGGKEAVDKGLVGKYHMCGTVQRRKER